MICSDFRSPTALVPSVINIPWTRLITFLMKPDMSDDAVIEFLPNHVSTFLNLNSKYWFVVYHVLNLLNTYITTSKYFTIFDKVEINPDQACMY